MNKLRKILKLSRKEMRILQVSVFASVFILASATVAASVEVQNEGHSYHTMQYEFTLLGGL